MPCLTSLDPECHDSQLNILTKILQRLNLNAGVQSDTPASSVAVTNFPAVQNVNIVGSTITVPVGDGGGSITVDNAGVFAVQVTSGGGGTQYAEDTPSVADEIITMAGVVRRDTIGTLVSADNDRTELQVNSSGSLRVDGSAVTQPISDGGGSITVDNAGVFAVQVTSGGGGTEYAEDTPSTAGEMVTMAGVVRKDTIGTLVDTDGDRTELQVNSSGSLRVDGSAVTQPVSDAGGSLTVDNTGTFAIQDSQKLADNSPFTDGTTPVQPAGYILDEVAGTALTENDVAAARIDSKRAQVTVIEDATTRGLRATVRDLASNDALNVAIVDGTGAQVTSFGGGGTTQYAEDTPSVAGEQLSMAGVVRKDTIGTLVDTDNDRTELQVNSSGSLRVDGSAVTQPISDAGGSITVDNAGIFAVQVDSGGTTQYAEDTAITAGELVTMAGVVRKDVIGSLVSADSERTELQVNAAGALRVDGSSFVQPVSFTPATGGVQQYNEDTVSASADVITMAGVVRKDTAATLVDTDGDRTQLQVNAIGSLWIADSEKITDNTAFTDGTSKVQPAGYIFDEVAGTALTENDAAAARIDSKRAIITTIEDATTRGLRATIRDLASNDALNVAIVDGTGAQVTSFGGGTQYAEDTASVAAELVTMAGVVRKDTAASLVDLDGDRTELQVNSTGALRVEVASGGTTQYAEDTASVADELVTMAGVVRKDTAASLVDTDGDRTELQVNSTGFLRVVNAVSEIKEKFGASTAMTITLASLASSTSGVGRQSTMVSNTTDRWRLITVYFLVTTGTTPTADRSIRFFLLKGDDPAASNIRTDNAGATDAGLTVITADQIYAVATTGTSNQAYRGSFVIQNPGPEWGIAVVHDTVAALNATGSNHSLRYVGENPEIQ